MKQDLVIYNLTNELINLINNSGLSITVVELVMEKIINQIKTEKDKVLKQQIEQNKQDKEIGL